MGTTKRQRERERARERERGGENKRHFELDERVHGALPLVTKDQGPGKRKTRKKKGRKVQC